MDEVLAVGDAEFQRKCLGKMNDVANEGRTVLFVSHNMSAILRLTQETIVLNEGKVVMRAPTPKAVDAYLNMGLTKAGERNWTETELAGESMAFRPIALRVCNPRNQVVDTVVAADGFSLELEYQLNESISGLRVGFYMLTTRGEYVFTTFDTDDPGLVSDLHLAACWPVYQPGADPAELDERRPLSAGRQCQHISDQALFPG